MKKLVFGIGLLAMGNAAWGQNSNLGFKYALKLSNQITFEKTSSTVGSIDTSNTNLFTTESKNWQILHPTISFQWKTKKNNFHEVELTSWGLNRNVSATKISNSNIPGFSNGQIIDGGRFTSAVISMRYEYILNFAKSKERKIVPSVGFGGQPFFSQVKFVPSTASAFEEAWRNFGVRGFVAPRITYYFSPKFFLDLNVVFTIVNFGIENQNRDNPIIPVDQRSITTLDFNQFPELFSGRVGIGFKI